MIENCISCISCCYFLLVSGKNGNSEFKHLDLNSINLIVRCGAYFFPRRGMTGRRPDFIWKHHASSSKMGAAWCMRHEAWCASKTNFQIGQLAVGHEVPLRGTFLIQPNDQAANLSEVGFAFLCHDSAKPEQVQLCSCCSIGSCMVLFLEIGSTNRSHLRCFPRTLVVIFKLLLKL